MLIAAPFFFFVIFLSGDSCCGENTSGTMLLVTFFITLIFLIPSVVLNVLFRIVFRKFYQGNILLLSILITWIVSAGIYWPFVIFVILTAFYI